MESNNSRMVDAFLTQVNLLTKEVQSFEEYPFSIPALNNFSTLSLHPRVTYFIGENGSGKSTLLEAIAVAEGFNPEGGGRNFDFETRRSHSLLFEHLELERGTRRLTGSDGFFFRAESYFNVATEIEELDRYENPNIPKIIDSYGHRSLHEQSHGESFWALIKHRLGGNGLYLFDEPESSLSPSRQLQLLAIMHEKLKHGSQLIIATHSPILLAYPESVIYEFSSTGIRETTYEMADQVKLTRNFLNRKSMMLTELFGESTNQDSSA